MSTNPMQPKFRHAALLNALAGGGTTVTRFAGRHGGGPEQTLNRLPAALTGY